MKLTNVSALYSDIAPLRSIEENITNWLDNNPICEDRWVDHVTFFNNPQAMLHSYLATYMSNTYVKDHTLVHLIEKDILSDSEISQELLDLFRDRINLLESLYQTHSTSRPL